ncbi:MAG: hypothetical protein HW401_257 [Parcubacteria group bacterium]|nr:hypothetical protein [Parcubacteria group bacterium]
MSSWSQRRKSSYLLIFAVFLFGFIILPAYLIFYKSPTCLDGKQNGSEKGIDCGGPCTNLCRSQYLDPNVIWARAIKVKPGLYNTLAYIENPNIGTGADSISYVFKIKDKDGVLIYEKKGKTFIPPNKFFAIFEDGISTGEKVPTKVIFEFTSEAVWKKQENREDGINVLKKAISREDSSPRIDATLGNNTLETIQNIEVVAIAYGEDENALGFSRTFIDKLTKGGSQDIAFTWPEPFTSNAVRIEIIPRVMNRFEK